MSMYPTQISGGDSSRRVNRLGIPTQNMGIDQELAVVGLTPIPPSTNNIDAANALSEAFDLGAQLAGTVLRINEQARIAQEQEDAKVAVYERGEAVKAAAGTFAELQPQIAERKLIAAVDDADLGDYVGDLIGSRSEGQSKAWRDEYDRQLRGRLLSEFGKQRADIREESKRNLIDASKNAAIGARSTDEINAAVQSAVSLGISEREAYGSVAVPALRLAAAQGDSEKFDAVARSIPESMYRDEITLGKVQLDKTRLSNETATLRQNDSAFSEWYTSNTSGPPAYEDAIAKLESTSLLPADRRQWLGIINADKERKFSETRQSAEDSLAGLVINGQLDEAQTRIVEYETTFGEKWGLSQRANLQKLQAQQIEEIAAREEAAWQSSVVQEAIRSSDAAIRGGGTPLANLPNEITYTLSNGKTAKLSKSDIIDMAVPTVMERIAKSTTDPMLAFATQVEWLSKNGVEYAPWKTSMSIGASASQDALSTPERAKPATDGFQLYRQLKSQNPALTMQMTDDKTRTFYDIAERLYLPSGDVNSALLNARAQLDSDDRPKTIARAREQLTKDYRPGVTLSQFYTQKHLGDKVRNIGTAVSVVEQQAAELVASGENPAKALDDIAKKYKASSAVIGGTNNRRVIHTAYNSFTPDMKANLDLYTKQILDSIHAGPLSNYKREDLSMEFDPSRNMFVVVDMIGQRIIAPGTRIDANDFMNVARQAFLDNTNAKRRKQTRPSTPNGDFVEITIQ